VSVTQVDDEHLDDELALALLERRVDDATRRRLDAHLDGCEMCREMVSGLALAGGTGSEDPEIAVGDDDEPTLLRPALLGRDSALPPEPTAPPFEPLDRGDMVENFRVMRLLGRGAMGEVYLARDTVLGRKVALKMIAHDLLGSEPAVRRFLFEARATARFNHPNIVTIHAVGKHGGRPYVALEYVEGENLRDRMRRDRPSLREAQRIALSVAEALAEAHAHGILHRDLKPANVVLGADGRVRVVDFGLAKAVHAIGEEEDPSLHSTSSSTWMVGTPRYMAPEQWQGAICTGAADVWALGVILFELCSGKRPYDIPNTVDMLRAVCSEEPAPKLSSVYGGPPRLSEIVAGCLMKKPEERTTARALAEALRLLIYPEQGLWASTEGPFRGLLPFTERHRALFFGRDAEIGAFLERLRLQPVLPVLGPSGAGKTSLVLAGVIPRLREQERWVVLQLRPGQRPFETLAARLERGDSGSFPAAGAGDSSQYAAVGAFESRAARLVNEPRRLSAELREMAERENAKVLLFVDQLEDLFTMVEDHDQQQRFLEAVCSAADDVDDPIRVVLALRHDFVDRLPAEGDLGVGLGHFTLLKPPDRESLRRILTEPVLRLGYAYEDDNLVEQMIASVQGEPQCLPLCEFAATQLWEQRDGMRKLMLRSAYDAMGGVGGALAQHADGVLAGLEPAQRDLARALLLRLVTPERTRRVVPKARALDGLGPSGEAVLKALVEARLVSVTKVRRGEESVIELAHASLVQTWKTLAEWLEHGVEELRMLAEATQAAELWERRGRRPEELWQGAALRDAERGLGVAAQSLSHTRVPQQVQRFLRASLDADRRRRQRRRWVRLGLGGAGTLAAAGAIAATIALGATRRDMHDARELAEASDRRASGERSRAEVEAARRAAASGALEEARARLRLALQLDDNLAARALWQELMAAPIVQRVTLEGPAVAVAVGSDGRTLVTTAADGSVHVVDAASGASRAVAPRGSPVGAVALADDGAVLGAEASGAVWLSRDGTPARTATLDGAATSAAAADGSAVAFAHGADIGVYTKNGELLLRETASGPVQALAIAGAGKMLAVAVGDAVELGTGDVKYRLEGDARAGVTIDAGGRLLATASSDGTVRLWRIEDRRLLRQWHVGGSPTAVALGADGKHLVTATAHEAVVWNLRARPAAVAHDGEVRAVCVGDAGVASAGADGTVRLWSADGRALGVVAEGTSIGALACVESSLAGGGNDGTVHVYALDAGAELAAVRAHGGAVTAVAFGDRGRLASGDAEGAVIAWDGSDLGKRQVMIASGAPVTGLGWGSHGDWLAAAGADGVLRLWGPRADPRTIEAHAPLRALIVADERLAALSGDGKVLLGEVAGDAVVAPSFTPQEVTALALGGGGGTLAVAVDGGAIDLVDLAAGRSRRIVYQAGDLRTLAFDRDASHLVAGVRDGRVRLWDVTGGPGTWRTIALLPQAGRLVTHRGVVDLDDPDALPAAPPPALVGAIRAAQHAEGAPLCVERDELEIWDPEGAERLASFHVDGAHGLASFARACATIDRERRLVVLAPGVDPRTYQSKVVALASGEKLLVALADNRTDIPSGEIVTTSPDTEDQRVTALASWAGGLAVADSQGNITLDGAGDTPRRWIASGGATPVTVLAAGPGDTIAAGHADGWLTLLDPENGEVLRRGRLHGAVADLRVEGNSLYAASELGDGLAWDLEPLSLDRCVVLRSVWERVPKVWDRGRAVAGEVALDDPCRPH
jgi:WD40 repeat protein/tRNA A-37 threonylcarbamoyl transferase component Bud32